MYLDCFTKLRKHPNGKIVPEHSHSAYELVYYLYGHGYCSFQPQNAANAEKITKEYAANTYFVCAPGTVHDETYLADTASIVARYHFDGADKSAVDLKTQFCTDSDLTVLDLLQKMVFELDNLQYKYETLVNNTLYELLVSIARREADNEKNIHNVDSSISYIDNHFTNKISIKHLAETSFYSVEHFRKLFKSRTGLTPKEYIMMKKLEKALKILSSTTLPLFQISDECGFENYNHFVNFCKNLTGRNPSQLKRIECAPADMVRQIFPDYKNKNC